MRIGKPEIVREHDTLCCRVSVASDAGHQTLWFSLPAAFEDLLAVPSDAFVVGLLVPAMAAGEDVHVAGAVSDRLLFNLSHAVQGVLRRGIPALRRVRIEADDVWQAEPRSGRGVATGFSGGVDSYCVLADTLLADVPERLKVTHLLFNNVGSHGSGGERLFRERYGRLVPAVRRLGIPFLAIDSNLQTFYRRTPAFRLTHTIRNAAVALLLQGGVERFMYASGYEYGSVFVGPTTDLAVCDPILLPLLSTRGFEMASVGGEYTRVMKTLRVAALPASYDTLDICCNPDNASGFINCSTCWKCLRTLVTLEIAGCLERYARSFDLAAYAEARQAYLATLSASDDPRLREIVEFAGERGFPLPTGGAAPSAAAEIA